MALILDSDAIIKLYKANILTTLVEAYDCRVTAEVFEEVVVQGEAAGHPDARTVSEILRSLIGAAGYAPGYPEFIAQSFHLGVGESSIIVLIEMAPLNLEALVVSDDRRFHRRLAGMGVTYMTTVDIQVLLYEDEAIDKSGATAVLDGLRPMVREQDYLQALRELEK